MIHSGGFGLFFYKPYDNGIFPYFQISHVYNKKASWTIALHQHRFRGIYHEDIEGALTESFRNERGERYKERERNSKPEKYSYNE